MQLATSAFARHLESEGAILRALLVALHLRVQKLYDDVIWQGLMPTFPKHNSWMVGYTPGRQAGEILNACRWLLHKAAVWHIPLALGGIDIKTAFDSMRAWDVADRMQRRGAHAQLVAAWLSECLCVEARVVVAGYTTVRMTRLDGGVAQGRRRTPQAWNFLLQDVLTSGGCEVFLSAVFLDGQEFPALWTWADNIYILAQSSAAVVAGILLGAMTTQG